MLRPICIAVFCIALPLASAPVSFTDPAFAQTPRKKPAAQSSSATKQAPMSEAEFQKKRGAAIAVPAPSNPEALDKWCWYQMFLRYGSRVSGEPRTLLLEADNAHRIKDTCVRTRGRTI